MTIPRLSPVEADGSSPQVPAGAEDSGTSISRLGRFETDLGGRLTRTSARWREITGLTVESADGDGWVRVIHPEDQDDVFADWVWASRDVRDFEREFRIRTPEGLERTVFVCAWPVRDAAERFCGYTGTLEDITERRQSLNAATSQN